MGFRGFKFGLPGKAGEPRRVIRVSRHFTTSRWVAEAAGVEREERVSL